LHYTRGNLHFARGEIVACRSEHEAALSCARALDDPAWLARAASGLADAAYAEGRMRTAFARFTQCVELCDAHGLMRVAIPNRAMAGHCRIYLMEFDAGIADMDAAHALARQVGDRHGEMFAQESLGVLLTLSARFGEAEPVLGRALALAEALGARRYQALLLASLAESLLATGNPAEAGVRNERALALARETGMRFCGPYVLALRTRMQDDPHERARSRAEAEALIAEGGVGHGPIGYHRVCIDDALARGEWSRALDHVAALEAYTGPEPLPYTDLLIARGRVLVGLASRPGDPVLGGELARLRAEAERVRWLIGWSP
jgi:tetratricopeptide (TPR) repeat protein